MVLDFLQTVPYPLLPDELPLLKRLLKGKSARKICNKFMYVFPGDELLKSNLQVKFQSRMSYCDRKNTQVSSWRGELNQNYLYNFLL